MSSRLLRILIIVLLVVANIGCDQVSKNLIRKKMVLNESVRFLGDHLSVTHVENSGAFLSLGNEISSTAKNNFLIILPLTILLVGLVFLLRNPQLPTPLLTGFCFILGGGIGNIFDRAVFGSVTDFLYLQWGMFHTGIFNLADLSITIGVVMVACSSLIRKYFF
ncbi:MAG: signal peptidase II [Bacteroidetes bacterium]|nr:MAG: signal peptidase II [Bacteroidota bacterium]